MATTLILEKPRGGELKCSATILATDGRDLAKQLWAARAIILAVSVALAWYTWGHWGDFQIDNGRELYVPAAILKGKLLFRDLWYMYGPLAPYFKATLFGIFGVRLTVLYVFGLALTIGTALITFEIARQMKLALPASVVPSLFFLVEAFYPFIRNFVFPYSYATSLGAFLGLACLHFVLRYASAHRRVHLAFAAAIGGLVILSKQEFGIACLALLALVVIAGYRTRRSVRDVFVNAGICVVGLLPAFAGYGWFVWKLSARIVFFENWIATPGTYFMRTFSKRGWADLGFRFVPAEVLETLEYAVLATAIWYALASINTLARQNLKAKSRFLASSLLIVTMMPFVITCLVFRNRAPWGLVVDTRQFARSLWEPAATRLFFSTLAEVVFPVGLFQFVVVYLVWGGWNYWRQTSKESAVQEIALGMYAVLVAVRQMMELEPTLYKCAVFFNVPAFLIFVILVDRVIRWASRSVTVQDRNFLSAGMWGGEVVCLFILFFPKPQILPARLTTEYGSFYTSRDVAVLFPQIISFMKAHSQNGKDILVVPEPPSLYVFAGMQSPSRWYSLMPGYIAPEQEPQYIEELKRNHVKYILIGNHDVSEYGTRRFEEGGYNKGIYNWIMANYVKVNQIGPVEGKAAPSTAYFLSIYEKKDDEPAASESRVGSFSP